MTGCGKRELKTGREGQGIKVAGVTYNVYITRQLNPRDAEDSAYTAGQNADQPGYYFYGVFLTACNDKTTTCKAKCTEDVCKATCETDHNTCVTGCTPKDGG